MKRLLLLLMLFSTPVMAVEPIVGAFGFKLGDVWDGEAIATFEKDGYFMHGFIPDSPLDAFNRYSVDVTPVKGLIFKIEAYKDGSCNSQFKALKQALGKKYGEGVRDPSGHIWTQGNRSITLYCWNTLRLTYWDQAIYESRIDELEAQVDSADL